MALLLTRSLLLALISFALRLLMIVMIPVEIFGAMGEVAMDWLCGRYQRILHG